MSMSYSALRSALFRLPPEFAHRVALESLRLAQRVGFSLNADLLESEPPVECLGLAFPNRVGLAAGYDKSGDYVDALGALGFGFIEVGTITPKPQAGNPKPRLYRIPAAQALINQMGSPNKGVAHAANRIQRCGYPGILGVNVGKNADTPLEEAPNDFLTCYRAVSPWADYVALNVSSPNTQGLRDLQASAHLRRILPPLAKARDEQARHVPILVKLSPDLSVPELNATAQTIADMDADGIIATNTTSSRDGLGLDRPELERGGLSGAPLQQRSLRVIEHLRKRLGDRLAIIGLGGIMSGSQARDTLAAGANLVQIYAGLIYRGPALIREICAATAD